MTAEGGGFTVAADTTRRLRTALAITPCAMEANA